MAQYYLGYAWNPETGRVGGPVFHDLGRNLPHMTLMAPPGGGKGVGQEIPNILSDGLRDANIISIDPAAQNLKVTMRWRGEVSDIALLNPCRMHGLGDDGFNPMPRVRSVQDALALGEALQLVRSTTEPFFEQGSQGLIAGVTLAVARDTSGKTPTLYDVRKILTGDLAAFVDAMIKSGNDDVASLLGGYNLKENRTVEAIKRTSEVATRFLLTEDMRRSLSVPKGVDWSRLKSGNRPLTVYVTVPAERLGSHGGESLAPFLRMVVVDLINTLFRMGGSGRPTVIMLSEFYSLGKLSPVLLALTQGRKFGMRVAPMVLQNIGQLTEVWGKSGASTIIGNSGCLVAFAPTPGDIETSEFLAKAGGVVATMARNASDDPQGGPARVTVSEHREQRWTPDRIRSLPEFHGLAWRGPVPQPVVCPPYWELPECRGRFDADPYHPGPPPAVFGTRRRGGVRALAGAFSAAMSAVTVAAGVAAFTPPPIRSEIAQDVRAAVAWAQNIGNPPQPPRPRVPPPAHRRPQQFTRR